MGSPQFPLNRYFRKPLAHKKSGEEHDHEDKHNDSSQKTTGLTDANHYSKNDLIELGHSVSALKQNIHLQTEKTNSPPELKLANPFPKELFAEDKQVLSKENSSNSIENPSKTYLYSFFKYIYNCLKLLLEQILELIIVLCKMLLQKKK